MIFSLCVNSIPGWHREHYPVINSGTDLTQLGTSAVKKEATHRDPASHCLPIGTGLFPGGENCITPNLKETPGTGLQTVAGVLQCHSVTEKKRDLLSSGALKQHCRTGLANGDLAGAMPGPCDTAPQLHPGAEQLQQRPYGSPQPKILSGVKKTKQQKKTQLFYLYLKSILNT